MRHGSAREAFLEDPSGVLAQRVELDLRRELGGDAQLGFVGGHEGRRFDDVVGDPVLIRVDEAAQFERIVAGDPARELVARAGQAAATPYSVLSLCTTTSNCS